MRRRIFFKLFAAALLIIAAATITLDISVRAAWERSLLQSIERSMKQKTLMFANRVRITDPKNYQAVAEEAAATADVRATIIDRTGKVLADTEANPVEMENHATRPEFMEAFRGGVGESTRFSHTVHIDFLYVAAPIPGGAVRMAYPLSSIKAVTGMVRRRLLAGSVLALLVAALMAGLGAHSISRRLRAIMVFAERIARGDLAARIDETSSYDEIAMVATSLDQTARRLENGFRALETSRKELETVLNSMQEAVIATAEDGRVLWANQRMNHLLPAGVRTGAPIVETLRDPDFLGALDEAVTQGKVQSARLNWAFVGRTFSVTAAPMPGGGAVAVLYDMSDIERLEKTRRDFIANVSHELRTPLTSIQGYAETLLDSPPNDPKLVQEFVEIIRKNATRMSRLTEDLLTLARVESGEHKFQITAITADALLRDAYGSFAEVARARKVELEIESTSEQPVLADADAVHQVFANLIDNALKYSAEGKRVLLGARKKDDALEFYVRDFGAGIPSEHLPRLFERFYRVDKARSRESGGTGLGLAIVKHIVRMHGGAVRATSEINRGSEFSFSLPLAPAEATLARA